jgi:hypothetical protein
MTYKLISDDEVQDFKAAIRDNRQQSQDFDLTERVENETGLEKGVAVVKCNKSGVERTYPVGHGTIFSADFAQDLERGIFS